MECHEERDLDVACEVCHVEMAAWSPDTDCALCHMVPNVESLEDTSLLAYAHVEEGLVCLDCHNDLEALEQVHQYAVPGGPVSALRVETDFCLDCHVANEHTSYEQVIELTADYMIDDQNINPHDPHESLESAEYDLGPYECSSCHKMHGGSLLINNCYGCHHEGTFESCSKCHGTEAGGTDD